MKKERSKKENLMLLLCFSAFVISIYMVIGLVMVLIVGKAIILGRNVGGHTLMMLEAPVLILILLSTVFFKRKAGFFCSASLFSAFSLTLFQRMDIRASLLFLGGLGFSILALIVGFPGENQQVSRKERATNIILSIATATVMLEVWNFTWSAWPEGLKLLVFLIGAVGILLLFSKNRVISSGGIPFLVFFYCSAAYAFYALNLVFWQYFWAVSVVLLAYSLIPLKKLLR